MQRTDSGSRYNARSSASLQRHVVKKLAKGHLSLQEAEDTLAERGLLSSRYKAQKQAGGFLSGLSGLHPLRRVQQAADVVNAIDRAVAPFVVPGAGLAYHPERLKRPGEVAKAAAYALPVEKAPVLVAGGVKGVRAALAANAAAQHVIGPEHAKNWQLDERGQFHEKTVEWHPMSRSYGEADLTRSLPYKHGLTPPLQRADVPSTTYAKQGTPAQQTFLKKRLQETVQAGKWPYKPPPGQFGMNIVGGPKYTQNWRYEPRIGTFVRKPRFRGEKIASLDYQLYNQPQEQWRSQKEEGPGIFNTPLGTKELVKKYLAGKRGYKPRKADFGAMNIVGPEGTPRHLPAGWRMGPDGRLYRPMKTDLPGTHVEQASEPYIISGQTPFSARPDNPNETTFRRTLPVEGQDPGMLDFGRTVKYGHRADWYDEQGYFEQQAREGVTGAVSGKRGFANPWAPYAGHMPPNSMNIIGRGGGPKPANSSWRINPRTGQPELRTGGLGYELPTTTEHTTDFTPLSQIPNKYNETRPWVHGPQELGDVKKSAWNQGFMVKLYEALGYPGMYSLPGPDPEDWGVAGYSSNFVGRR